GAAAARALRAGGAGGNAPHSPRLVAVGGAAVRAARRRSRVALARDGRSPVPFPRARGLREDEALHAALRLLRRAAPPGLDARASAASPRLARAARARADGSVRRCAARAGVDCSLAPRLVARARARPEPAAALPARVQGGALRAAARAAARRTDGR